MISVELREVADLDLPTFFEYQLDSVAVHMLAFIQREPDDRAAFDAHWKKILADPKIKTQSVIADGQLVGFVLFFKLGGERQIGYWIDRAHWGKGLATAALREFLLQLDERPLYGRCAADNIGSRRVLEKCGFRLDQQTRCESRSRGEVIDELVLILE